MSIPKDYVYYSDSVPSNYTDLPTENINKYEEENLRYIRQISIDYALKTENVKSENDVISAARKYYDFIRYSY